MVSINTDSYGSDSNSDNQPGKRFLLGKSYPSGNKMCNIHSLGNMEVDTQSENVRVVNLFSYLSVCTNVALFKAQK